MTGILYGAKLTLHKTDLKRLVAYTSVSHMGFVILGVFSFNEIAYQGVVVQMVAHGISTGALFILVGQLYKRVPTQEILIKWEGSGKKYLLWVLSGSYCHGITGLTGLGISLRTLDSDWGIQDKYFNVMSCKPGPYRSNHLFSLGLFQKVFLGNKNTDWKMTDLTIREKVVSALMVVAIVGLFPKPVLDAAKPAILKTLNKQKEVTYHKMLLVTKCLCEPL